MTTPPGGSPADWSHGQGGYQGDGPGPHSFPGQQQGEQRHDEWQQAEWQYGQRQEPGPEQPYGQRQSYGEQRPYGEQQPQERQPYEQQSYGEQRSYGDQQDPFDSYPYPHPGQQQPPRPAQPQQQPTHPQQRQPVRPDGPRAPLPRQNAAGGAGGSAGRGPSPLVRPYAMTGGRTRPRYQLAIEALVSTTAQPSQMQGQLPEHQRICNLCREIKSVAEISALLSIPLGVARILVADLAEAGLVAIHQPGGDENAGG
ncbi:DUF742 domain-containing protein, partial [Streptomyces sp. NPDC047046]|uniref:DUF742 domain-containing protein n=1 Tax=Streptomyces sp. NPDC047046 TaxID=3155378 RepID=UPI003403FF4A